MASYVWCCYLRHLHKIYPVDSVTDGCLLNCLAGLDVECAGVFDNVD
jgi:hypothetical protein